MRGRNTYFWTPSIFTLGVHLCAGEALSDLRVWNSRHSAPFSLCPVNSLWKPDTSFEFRLYVYPLSQLTCQFTVKPSIHDLDCAPDLSMGTSCHVFRCLDEFEMELQCYFSLSIGDWWTCRDCRKYCWDLRMMSCTRRLVSRHISWLIID